jgi:hypothetical protein
VRPNTIAVLVFLLASLGASHCQAEMLLTLSTSDDLTHLGIGASATFNVTLSGVNTSDPPGYLSVGFQYDPSVLSIATVTPGSIVPDLGGFDSSGTGPGVVSAYYDDSLVPSAPITGDGLFFSFAVTRIGAAGTSVSFLSFAAQDDAGNNLTLSATPSSLAITPAVVPVPEASSLTIALIGLTVAASGCLLRRHRKTSTNRFAR